MKSDCVLYKLVLSPKRTCKLPSLPDSRLLEKALPGCICSDLFVDGFSYKKLTLCSGFTAQGEQYRLLKQLKSAKYIADHLKMLSPADLIAQLDRGNIAVLDGYIGHTRQVSLAVRPAPLTEGDKRFGIELRKDSRFCCYAKTENATFPETLQLGDCEMAVQEVMPVKLPNLEQYVLQSDLPLTRTPRLEPCSNSRFKLTYDAASGQMLLCAGSCISPADDFGEGLLL